MNTGSPSKLRLLLVTTLLITLGCCQSQPMPTSNDPSQPPADELFQTELAKRGSRDNRDFLGRLGGVVAREYRESGHPVTQEVLEVADDGITAIGTFAGKDG